jgi:hypothetical protein
MHRPVEPPGKLPVFQQHQHMVGLVGSGAICTSQDTGLRLPVPTSTR